MCKRCKENARKLVVEKIERVWRELPKTLGIVAADSRTLSRWI